MSAAVVAVKLVALRFDYIGWNCLQVHIRGSMQTCVHLSFCCLFLSLLKGVSAAEETAFPLSQLKGHISRAPVFHLHVFGSENIETTCLL